MADILGRSREGLREVVHQLSGPSGGLQVVVTSGATVVKEPPHPAHRGRAVRVGPYKIYAGGTRYLQPEDLERFDLIIPLEPKIPTRLGHRQHVEILGCPWPDYGPPPEGFEEFLWNEVIPELKRGKRILVYCIGSHGRTGTFLASLIALLESPERTPDPIAAVRRRHCDHAVETLKQARYIFALRGEELPEEYEIEFTPPPPPVAVVKGVEVSAGSYVLPDRSENLLEMDPAEFRRRFGPDGAGPKVP